MTGWSYRCADCGTKVTLMAGSPAVEDSETHGLLCSTCVEGRNVCYRHMVTDCPKADARGLQACPAIAVDHEWDAQRRLPDLDRS